MSIRDKKIASWTSPVVNESDRPQRTASEMKAVFDSNSNQLRTALNGLIDELSENGAGELGAESVEGIDGATVQEQLESLNDKKLNKDGDSSENTVTFAEAATYADPASGDTHATLFGKILKRFNLLGALANKNTVTVTDINNGAVTNAKQANMPALTIKGNANSASAAPGDLSVSDVKGMLGLRTDGGMDQFLNASGNYSAVPFAGNGLPAGGRVGQKLVKSVEEDYEAGWVDDFIVDSTMSDASANLVQNKTIKQYVDNAIADVEISVPTGMLKGNSDGSIVNAVAGTDYQAPLRAGTDYQTPLEAGIDYQTPLTIDSVMSDTSSNPIQNKAIKAYVDKAVADAATGDITVPTGMLKGNSDGSIVQAVAGTDYQTPLRAGTDYQTPLEAGTDYQTPLSAGTDYQTPLEAGVDYQVPLEAGTDYQTPLTIDSAMSDASSNPVQNKAIKQYVDYGDNEQGERLTELETYFADDDVNDYYYIKITKGKSETGDAGFALGAVDGDGNRLSQRVLHGFSTNGGYSKYKNPDFSTALEVGENLEGGLIKLYDSTGQLNKVIRGKRYGSLPDSGTALINGAEYHVGAYVGTYAFEWPPAPFEAWVKFAVASSFNITFPSGTTYIGGAPSFKAGSTYEMSVKDAVVICQEIVAEGGSDSVPEPT